MVTMVYCSQVLRWSSQEGRPKKSADSTQRTNPTPVFRLPRPEIALVVTGERASLNEGAQFPGSAAGEARREAPALQRPEEPPQPPPLHALHHALHFLKLLEQAVDVLHLHAGASRNAAAPRSIDDAGVAPLARGHGVDDGDLPPQLPIALVGRDRAFLRYRPGKLIQQRADAAHLLQLLELAPQVAHVEALALDDLLREALRL